MPLSRSDRRSYADHAFGEVASRRHVTSTDSIDLTDRHVTVDPASAAFTLTLPPVAEAKGLTFMIRHAGTGMNAVTIDDSSNDALGFTPLTLDSKGEFVELESDGTAWRQISGRRPTKRGCFTQFKSVGPVTQSDGTAASGTAGEVNLVMVDDVALQIVPMGTQTILAPTQHASGLNVAYDQTDNDGIEINCGSTTRSPCAFTVGTDAFFAELEFTITTVAGTDDCAFGFRINGAHAANIDDLTDMAVLNVISGDIKIETILNNAATTTTDTTDNWADGETHRLRVEVARSGAVTYLIDGDAPTVTAAFTFDSGDVVVPFFYMLQANAVQTGAVYLSKLSVGVL